MTRVSVCLASCNGARYISAQLKSILSQLGDDDELVVSDDSSTDETVALIRSVGDDRIRLFENRGYRNHILNFEFTLSQARGEYIFLSDQDDIWLDGKVEIMVQALQKAGLVVSDCRVVNGDLSVLQESFYNGKFRRSGFWRNVMRNKYLGCCMAFKRSILDHALPFPKGLITHDSWLGLIAESHASTVFIQDRLILFRRHEACLSCTMKKSTLSIRDRIACRMFLLFHIFRRRLGRFPLVWAVKGKV